MGIRNLEWIVGENIIITTIGSTLCDFSFRVVAESIVTYRSNIKFPPAEGVKPSSSLLHEVKKKGNAIKSIPI